MAPGTDLARDFCAGIGPLQLGDVLVFGQKKMSKDHDILALGLILANLKHDEAQFSKFWFFRLVHLLS